MNSKVLTALGLFSVLLVTASCAGRLSAPVEAGGTRIIQPGAPGEISQIFDTAELEAIRGLGYSEADVRFMRGMIPHHGQALDMTAMVPTRATTDSFRGMALRMQISQKDEIRLMERWLDEREEEVPAANTHRTMITGGMGLMPGMLDPEQMERAFGIALSQSAGSMQFLADGAWTKRFHVGHAAMCGLMAATFAGEGFKGSR